MSVTLMRGRIGSGKSFEARKICGETGARLLSVDYFMEGVFGDECIGRERHVSAERKVLAFCLDMAKELDGCSVDAVIDHGFWLKEELAEAEAFLKENKIEYRVFTAEADFDTRLARVKDRKDGKQFSRDKLEFFDKYFEE